ncbi:MAG: 30S ribosomal protein S16 [Acidimicrobiia bacterium]
MAVKIRLTRKGKKHQPTYRVVVADARSPRDGRFIEQIGRYDPRQEPSIIEIDNERAAYWLASGAQPSDQVRKLLEVSGAMEARPEKDRAVHVVGEDAQRQAEAEAEAEAAVTDAKDVEIEETPAEPVVEVEVEVAAEAEAAPVAEDDEAAAEPADDTATDEEEKP